MAIQIDEADRLMSADDVAEWAKISRRSVDRLVREGTLPAPTFRVGAKSPRWTLADLQRHLQENLQAA